MKLTYNDLHQLLKNFLTGFKNHGVLPGERVMINSENSSNILAAIYTLMFYGAVVVFPGAKRTASEDFSIEFSTHLVTALTKEACLLFCVS